jgi:hypothetical protein
MIISLLIWRDLITETPATNKIPLKMVLKNKPKHGLHLKNDMLGGKMIVKSRGFMKFATHAIDGGNKMNGIGEWVSQEIRR